MGVAAADAFTLLVALAAIHRRSRTVARAARAHENARQRREAESAPSCASQAIAPRHHYQCSLEGSSKSAWQAADWPSPSL